MAVFSRRLGHVIVLALVVTLSGYASVAKDLPAATRFSLGVVNAQGLAFGQGGSAGQVELGRAGTIVKPLAIPTTAAVRHNPTVYTVRAGEDLAAVARKFNLEPDQVRWSNPEQLTKSDRLTAGDRIMIPPVPGIVVVVKQETSVRRLAASYGVDPQRIVDFNYLRDVDRLLPAQVLVLPNGKGPALFPRRVSNEAPHLGDFEKDKFAYGYCTWYVASRRYVPWTGDAWEWFGNARVMGFATGQLPAPGAIMVTSEGPVGHVAFVEQVNADGSFVVSEMNYKGWDVLSTRLLDGPSQVPLTGFIY